MMYDVYLTDAFVLEYHYNHDHNSEYHIVMYICIKPSIASKCVQTQTHILKIQCTYLFIHTLKHNSI
jgi:hypothetical protein